MPWVPRDLYDLMLTSLRETRGPAASTRLACANEVFGEPAAPVVEPTAAEPAPAPLMLSPAVYEACVRYAFGDPNEKQMNLAQAKRLMREGSTDSQIIAHVRAGGPQVSV